MTADFETTSEETTENESKNGLPSSNFSCREKYNDLEITMIEKIFEFLSQNPKIYFKSQQIDDPDILESEKIAIAQQIFSENHEKFLERFGRFLTKEHLNFFQNSINFNEKYEITIILQNLQSELQNRSKNIKNRRFAAMKSMMLQQDDYFSETEMMKREPLLYEQLIGQYLTDTEKKIRDGFDPKNTPFSQVLLDNYDKDITNELRKNQAIIEGVDDDDSTQQSFCPSQQNDNDSDETFPKLPPSYRKQWGNFDDENESVKPSTSFGSSRNIDVKQKYITASEREMLRQEFLGIMHTKFLEGDDKDFDYGNIDYNEDLDDLEQMGQDKEDKYFDEDDDDYFNDENHIISKNNSSDTEDDDLDIFMNSLDKNSCSK